MNTRRLRMSTIMQRCGKGHINDLPPEVHGFIMEKIVECNWECGKDLVNFCNVMGYYIPSTFVQWPEGYMIKHVRLTSIRENMKGKKYFEHKEKVREYKRAVHHARNRVAALAMGLEMSDSWWTIQ